MKQVLIDIAKALVSKPEEVVVTEKRDGNVLHLELSVAPEDMGKVIGKQGKIAKAMRTIVRAATPRSSKRYVVEIREKGGNSVDLGDETEAE